MIPVISFDWGLKIHFDSCDSFDFVAFCTISLIFNQNRITEIT
jgi:hypothetical protein